MHLRLTWQNFCVRVDVGHAGLVRFDEKSNSDPLVIHFNRVRRRSAPTPWPHLLVYNADWV